MAASREFPPDPEQGLTPVRIAITMVQEILTMLRSLNVHLKYTINMKANVILQVEQVIHQKAAQFQASSPLPYNNAVAVSFAHRLPLIIGDIFTPCLTCRLKRRSASYGPNHAIRNSEKAPKHLGPVAIAIDRSATNTFVSNEIPHQNPHYGAQVGCGIPPRPI